MKNTTVFVLCIFFLFSLITGQKRQLPKTPLSQEILDLLAMEISGQVIFNNEIILAGAPWIREAETGKKLGLDTLPAYLEFLKKIGWLTKVS